MGKTMGIVYLPCLLGYSPNWLWLLYTYLVHWICTAIQSPWAPGFLTTVAGDLHNPSYRLNFLSI